MRGADLSAFSPRLALGIRLHRRVDALFDVHPAMVSLKALVDPDLRRYAGILCDVFLDHVLLSQWGDWHSASIENFTSGVYASLGRMAPALPEATRTAAERIARFDALTSCASRAGVAATLGRIARRLKRPTDLAAGVATLERHGERLAAELPPIFADVRSGALAYLGSSLTMRPSELSVSR
ncbi:MAG: DUF479 domain-containing protein [Burkholderiales bacterium]|nr:DUF479 domain-containing protein [Burkholderiales bacterium]